MLIEDPISKTGRSSSGLGKSLESLALNQVYRTDIPTLIEYLKSEPILASVAKQNNISTQTIISSLKINYNLDSFRRPLKIVEVTLLYPNPWKGKKILKDISQVYLKTSQLRRQQKLDEGLKFLNNQTPKALQELNDLETKLALFRAENNTINPEAEAINLRKREIKIQENIANLKNEREKLFSIKKEIQSGNLYATGLVSDETGGVLISDPAKNTLIKYSRLKDEIAEAKLKFQPGSISLINLQNRLYELEPILLESQLNSINKALKLNEENLQINIKNKEQLNMEFSKTPNLIRKYQRLSQELDSARQNVSVIISAKEQFQLEVAQTTIPWEILKQPIFSYKPVAPRIGKVLLRDFFLALFAGIIIAFIRDKFDNVFHSDSEVENELKQPILAKIPYIPAFKNFKDENKTFQEKSEFINNPSSDNQYSSFYLKESLRSFYTSLTFLNSDQKIKLLMISSCMPSEGKSLLNIIFAQTLCELGKKILLIDCDLRKPTLHKRLGLNNIKGITNYLSGKYNDFNDVIQEVNYIDNLKVVTSGIIPPDPLRLINSDKMTNLIRDLKNNEDFDYIMLDTTPLVGLAETNVLASLSDGLVMLISMNNISKPIPKKYLKEISDKEINLLGVLLNSKSLPKSIDKRSSSGYGYGYGYGYEYGYGAKVYQSYRDKKEDKDQKKKKDKLFKNMPQSVNYLIAKINEFVRSL